LYSVTNGNKLPVADTAAENIKVAVQESTFSFSEHIKRFRLVCLHGGNRLREHSFGFIPTARTPLMRA
jgi:hypothetical protein